MIRGSSLPHYLAAAGRYCPITAKVLRANGISRQCGASADAGFHFLTAKHDLVISASPFCVPSASTATINPSNARDGADDHAALSAVEIREAPQSTDATTPRHGRGRAGCPGPWFRIVAGGLGADGERTGAGPDHASGQ